MTGLVQRLRDVLSPDFDDLDEPIGGRGPPLEEHDDTGLAMTTDHDWLNEREEKRIKFHCRACGDMYKFVEVADLPVYCPTCGADQTDSAEGADT